MKFLVIYRPVWLWGHLGNEGEVVDLSPVELDRLSRDVAGAFIAPRLRPFEDDARALIAEHVLSAEPGSLLDARVSGSRTGTAAGCR